MHTTEEDIRQWHERYQNSSQPERILNHLNRLHALFKTRGHVLATHDGTMQLGCLVVINDYELYQKLTEDLTTEETDEKTNKE